MTTFTLRPVGRVRSPLTDRGTAPRQADEGAPSAVVEFEPAVAEALADLAVGDQIVLLTWFHHADRDVLAVRPRGDSERPMTGVFSTRSPDRPNPIGLHVVTVTAVDGLRLSVDHLEAIDQTPVVDVKPVLADPNRR